MKWKRGRGPVEDEAGADQDERVEVKRHDGLDDAACVFDAIRSRGVHENQLSVRTCHHKHSQTARNKTNGGKRADQKGNRRKTRESNRNENRTESEESERRRR